MSPDERKQLAATYDAALGHAFALLSHPRSRLFAHPSRAHEAHCLLPVQPTAVTGEAGWLLRDHNGWQVNAATALALHESGLLGYSLAHLAASEWRARNGAVALDPFSGPVRQLMSAVPRPVDRARVTNRGR